MAKRGGFPGGMPGNMNNLMKQAQRMQRQMEENQRELEAKEFTANARANGIGVIIAAAGKAAYLAGAIAANTTLPVIGIPIKASALEGMDALLSTVQMPAGIPVATVAIDGAENAALLAIQILAVEDGALTEKLQSARDSKKAKILEKDKEINEKYR